MEYNYTREFKQPIKIYSIKGHAIPLAPNGIRFEHIVVGGVFLFLALLIWLLGLLPRCPLSNPCLRIIG